METWEQFAVTFADIARDLLGQDGQQATLDRIVAHAVDVVEGCDAASVMVLARGGVRTLATTGARATAADQVQGRLRSGPCFDAITVKAQLYRLDDTCDDQHWPEFAAAMAEHGIGSVMGFLLHATDHDNLGALNLYATTPHAFADRAERAGWILASHSAVALATVRRDDALQVALRNSRDIATAVGIVMARRNLHQDHAFDLLQKYSQNHNLKIVDLAARIIHTGELPSG